MSDRKRIIIIAIVVILVVLLLIALVWWLINRQQERLPEPPSTGGNQPRQEIVDQMSQLPPPSPERMSAEDSYPLDLKQLAFSFAERYGSYSNQGGYKNLADLKSLMTSKMINQVDDFTTETRLSGGDYEGYDTRALTSEFLEFSETRAKVSVGTQRFHYQGDSANPEIFYQDLTLYLVKAGNDWKIDEAYWEK